MEIIRVDTIHKSFKGVEVLKGVSFSIHQPMILALVGPNGSGKSTLLNIMMNLLQPDQGTVDILGKKPDDVTVFREVSFLKDNTVLYPYLTGLDHLLYAAKTYGLSKERIHEVTEELGITSYMTKKVGTYSLGMKQHLLLALALLNDPEVFVLDEPLTGLDPTSVIKVRKLLLDLKARGKTVLLSSHSLSEIDAVTTDILFLKDGQVWQEKISRGSSEDRYRDIYEGIS